MTGFRRGERGRPARRRCSLLSGGSLSSNETGSGDDILLGGGGRDELNGHDGADEIKGGPGDDVIRGGPGFDRCEGGGGSDTVMQCEA
ncbi:MAG: hypothetical protein H0W09_03375 [Solirubrobacterales bacterium]|nr:hypothetical protein [Solirubrobacterales bacterium]